MFRAKARAIPRTATINGQAVTVEADETLLQAALRAGIAFPHSCRVGGCASCKCRLISGQVRELTETGYLLSDEELDQGCILACQSVPKSDIRIEVELSAFAPRREVRGKIVGQARLTHDITHLQVQFDAALDYRAGQFADLTLDALPGVTRSYSFATPAQPDGQASFFVRHVPDGTFSSAVNAQDLRGQGITLNGPAGDFWLRPGNAPILLVAGGSGLAPILAILREAAAAGCTRSVTLLFGARTRRDLYALDEIAKLQRNWAGGFRFTPILSGLSPDDAWTGARGMVTDLLLQGLDPAAQAYLCGPPIMVDAAEAMLREAGVAPTRIHADRFLTQAEAGPVRAAQSVRPVALHAGPLPAGLPVQAPAVAAAAADWQAKPDRAARQPSGESEQRHAGLFDYLKFFLFHVIGLAALGVIIAGRHAPTLGLFAVLGFYVIGDALAGDDLSTPHYRAPRILTVQLWLALPLLALISFAAVWSVSPGDSLGFGAWLSTWTHTDLLAARAASGWVDQACTLVVTGLMIGMVGTIPAHELTHRTWDPVSMWFGRWLLAFSFDTIFSIEHVYGHHRYVSTEDDPATAPRGRDVYTHVLVSTVRGNLSAWRIERRRLQRRGYRLWSWRNAFLRGHLMSVFLIALAWWLGGMGATLFFLGCVLWGKSLLEIVNYMEHYGIVRDPAMPVQPRHSWNTTRRISSWAMFNLTRHSHHHAQGETPYHALQPFPEAPQMVSGYLTTILIALLPPLWHYLMTPKVLAWDRDYASPGERVLIQRANARSGIRRLQQAALAA